MLDAAPGEYLIRCECGAFIGLTREEKTLCPACGKRYPAWVDYAKGRHKSLRCILYPNP